MTETRLKAIVRGVGYAVLCAFGVVMLGGFVALLVTLWMAAGPLWTIGFVGLLLVVEWVLRFVAAVIEWATS